MTSMRFTAHIDTRSDASQDGHGLAEMFRRTADRLQGLAAPEEDEGPIKDLNGNTVGRWWFTRDDDDNDPGGQ